VSASAGASTETWESRRKRTIDMDEIERFLCQIAVASPLSEPISPFQQHKYISSGVLLSQVARIVGMSSTLTGGATENKEDKNLYKQVIRLL
jgi:hypothetical protein